MSDSLNVFVGTFLEVLDCKLETLYDVYAFLQEHNIRAHRYCIEVGNNQKTYILTCTVPGAGTWVDIDKNYTFIPIITENQTVPYIEVMQIFDDEKIPYNIVTGAFSYWGVRW